MPLARYFAWVGSVLLALLFIIDACLTSPLPAVKGDTSIPLIRIHSEHKWPAPVAFDTSAPPVRPVQADNPGAGSPAPAIAVASRDVRAAFAEQRTADARPSPANRIKPEARHQREHKFTRKPAVRPVRLATRRFPFGWYDPIIW